MKFAPTPLANTLAACALALGLGISAAHAAGASLPPTHTQGGITYVSGGVGEGQSDAMKAAAAQYPLELLFLQKETPRDAYLADVKVQIADAQKNTLLNANADGPFMLVQLPPGKYSISADSNGQVQQREVPVSKEHRRVVFEWAGPGH